LRCSLAPFGSLARASVTAADGPTIDSAETVRRGEAGEIGLTETEDCEVGNNASLASGDGVVEGAIGIDSGVVIEALGGESEPDPRNTLSP